VHYTNLLMPRRRWQPTVRVANEVAAVTLQERHVAELYAPSRPGVLPQMNQRLIVALDVPDVQRARDIVAQLDGTVSFFKIGMWLLFKKETDALIDDLVGAGKQVFLDYKMYDIGETVKRGVEAAAKRGISFVTVHGDEAIMKAAAEGRAGSDLKIFAITVLTSLNDSALHGMGYRVGVQDLISLRVALALKCGCDGIIASASDDPDSIRRLAGSDSLLIATPGVRMAGGKTDDHQRSADPATAISKGADYLVVGRPILEAPDLAARAHEIIAEMERGWRARLSTPV
jgi:orotidine-5'-phosphate decarboxylase